MTGEPRDPSTGEARQGDGPPSADHPERAGSTVAADGGRAARAKRTLGGHLDRGLFLVVCIVLGVLMLVLRMSLFVRCTSYRDAIAHGFERVAAIDHASVIGYAPALDFPVAKTTALFLAFTLAFVGLSSPLNKGGVASHRVRVYPT